MLGLSDQQVHSVVVFVGDSKFKTAMPENVTYGRGYIKYIKPKQQPVIFPEEVQEIIEKIETGRLMPSFKTNREHVKNLENKLYPQ